MVRGGEGVEGEMGRDRRSLSFLERHLLPCLLESKEGGALKISKNCLQRVVVAELMTLASTYC